MLQLLNRGFKFADLAHVVIAVRLTGRIFLARIDLTLIKCELHFFVAQRIVFAMRVPLRLGWSRTT